MELTKSFSAEQYTGGLESWQWLGIEGKVPLWTSLFGDVFLDSDEGVWFLDSLEGSMTRVWDSPNAARAALATEDGASRYLMAGLALAAERAGIVPGPDQVYDFNPPPILGGTLDVQHIMVLDFVVYLNIAGQLHEQVRALPRGTPITGVKITGRSLGDAEA